MMENQIRIPTKEPFRKSYRISFGSRNFEWSSEGYQIEDMDECFGYMIRGELEPDDDDRARFY